MRRVLASRCGLSLVAVVIAVAACSATAKAGTIPVGYLSWDVDFPANAGEFDIVNETGPNSSVFPDTTFPITNILNLSALSLTVHFNNGSTVVEASSYFSLSPDGESFNGTPIPIGGTNPIPVSATLTGNFSPLTVTLNSGGGPQSILPGFTTTDSDSPTLVDGDLSIIYATTGTSSVPEPATCTFLAIGLGCLLVARQKRAGLNWKGLLPMKGVLPVLFCCGESVRFRASEPEFVGRALERRGGRDQRKHHGDIVPVGVDQPGKRSREDFQHLRRRRSDHGECQQREDGCRLIAES